MPEVGCFHKIRHCSLFATSSGQQLLGELGTAKQQNISRRSTPLVSPIPGCWGIAHGDRVLERWRKQYRDTIGKQNSFSRGGRTRVFGKEGA